MSKKLQSIVNIEGLSMLGIASLSFMFCILVAGCNNSGPDLNWLDVHPGWDTVLIDVDSASHPKQFEFEKRKIRAYVRGWADEYNLDSGTHYHVTRFEFIPQSSMPRHYTVRAYLRPHVKEAEGHHEGDQGQHLIPTEPPPPK